ncbi:small heat shock protein [Aeropyrum pernix K1]|uniref:Small heat shock protein n=2 Tax=Aeropyrum pernix TaxID=56636 RepID=Q9YAJ0_AERPE|nr:archaeal heat shock protein Hsp20 [Aeropyrum pernix]BAA80959.2 small heat shock protein [Aeropyrum pernix K1]
MSWFRRRRKSFFDLLEDIFREFEEEFRELEEEFEKLASRVQSRGEEFGKGPYIYGVRITIGPDGVPKVEEFGNIRMARGRPQIREEMEPLVDVIERDDEVWIVADIPGANKDKIKVRATEDKVVIKAENGKKYYKEVELPAKVDPKSAKASYRNGVLEIKLKKIKPAEEGTEVKVE